MSQHDEMARMDAEMALETANLPQSNEKYTVLPLILCDTLFNKEDEEIKQRHLFVTGREPGEAYKNWSLPDPTNLHHIDKIRVIDMMTLQVPENVDPATFKAVFLQASMLRIKKNNSIVREIPFSEMVQYKIMPDMPDGEITAHSKIEPKFSTWYALPEPLTIQKGAAIRMEIVPLPGVKTATKKFDVDGTTVLALNTEFPGVDAKELGDSTNGHGIRVEFAARRIFVKD